MGMLAGQEVELGWVEKCYTKMNKRLENKNIIVIAVRQGIDRATAI